MRLTTGTLLGCVLILAATRCAPAQVVLADRYDLARRAARFDLPGRLDEVSGLAFTPDGRLFAHGDERGRVHEIDPRTGEVGKRFSLGEDDVRDDFEGIAIAGERFFLISSRGLLYEFREADDRQETPYRRTDLGIGDECEAEGLEFDAPHQRLLVACKTVPGRPGVLVVHRIPLDPEAPRPPPLVVTPDALEPFGGSGFHASGVALDPATHTLILVSAREESILELAPDGAVLTLIELSKDRHGQPEGVAFGPDGTLYIADEENDKDARLTVYSRSGRAPGS